MKSRISRSGRWQNWDRVRKAGSLVLAGGRTGTGSIVVQTIIVSGPLSGGQIKLRVIVSPESSLFYIAYFGASKFNCCSRHVRIPARSTGRTRQSRREVKELRAKPLVPSIQILGLVPLHNQFQRRQIEWIRHDTDRPVACRLLCMIRVHQGNPLRSYHELRHGIERINNNLDSAMVAKMGEDPVFPMRGTS